MMFGIKSDRGAGTLTRTPATGQKHYYTWYEFKKELESLYGYPVLNTLWLQVKPQKPLPWNKSNILSALSKLKRN